MIFDTSLVKLGGGWYFRISFVIDTCSKGNWMPNTQDLKRKEAFLTKKKKEISVSFLLKLALYEGAVSGDGKRAILHLLSNHRKGLPHPCNTLGLQNKYQPVKASCYCTRFVSKPTTHEGIDNLVTSRWYKCIYLPPYSSELSPIEQFWAIVKNSVKRSKFDAIEGSSYKNYWGM